MKLKDCYLVIESFRDDFDEEQNDILYITTDETKAQKFYDERFATTPLKNNTYDFYEEDYYSFYGFDDVFGGNYYELRIIKRNIE